MTDARGQSVVVVVDEVTRVGEARREDGFAWPNSSALTRFRRGKAALIATEAASNLVKHAGGGELILQATRRRAGRIKASRFWRVDSGPGMSDVGRCMADGYSSAGTPGNGLGAIRRIADAFDIYSVPGGGTVVLARLRVSGSRTLASDMRRTRRRSDVRIAVPGEQVCGDNWSTVARDGSQFRPGGRRAGSRAAGGAGGRRSRARFPRTSLARTSRHRRVDSPGASGHARGRAGDRAARPDKGEVRYAGVGNISGVILDRSTGRTDQYGLAERHGRVHDSQDPVV